MARIIEVKEPVELPGILFEGKEYAIDPMVDEMAEAMDLLRDPEKGKDIRNQVRAIRIFIPEMAKVQIKNSQVAPILKAITEAIKPLKNAEGPAPATSG